jgi:hypothetical protein
MTNSYTLDRLHSSLHLNRVCNNIMCQTALHNMAMTVTQARRVPPQTGYETLIGPEAATTHSKSAAEVQLVA